MITQIEMPASEAMNGLKGHEVIAVESRFGRPFNELSPISQMMGVIYAYAKREDKASKPAVVWGMVTELTLAEMNDLFEPEPDGLDEDDEGNSDAA